jgi:putative ABC transport system substrate-binding protein
MKKTWIAVLVLVVLIVGAYLVFSPKNNPKTVRVGVSYITSMSAIEDVKNGIIAGFKTAGYEDGKNVVFDFQNAQGDMSVNTAIAQKFANGDYDLFIPITTPSAQALANLIKIKPIVFSTVSDPISAGLVKSESIPGGNITGVKDTSLYKESLELIKKIVPNAKKVGIIYNPGESNSQFGINQTKDYAGTMGLEIVTAPANNTNEILAAARSIASKVDVFLMTADNTVVSGQEVLIKVALETKKPMIAYEQTGVEKGALAAVGSNYEKIGERTAEMAIKVIKGENPANMPIIGVTDANLFLNSTTAQKIGITFSQELINQAKQIYK